MWLVDVGIGIIQSIHIYSIYSIYSIFVSFSVIFRFQSTFGAIFLTPYPYWRNPGAQSPGELIGGLLPASDIVIYIYLYIYICIHT